MDKTAMREVRANKPPSAKQRALPLRATGEPAPAIRGRLHRIWRAPPQPAAETTHFWRNLLATARLAPQASGKRWSQPLRRLNYVLMSPPGNLGQVEAYRSEPISGARKRDHFSVSRGPASRLQTGAAAATKGPPNHFTWARGGTHSGWPQLWQPTHLPRLSWVGLPWYLKPDFGLDERECGGVGPRADLRRISVEAEPVVQKTQFAQAGMELLPLRNPDAIFRAAASGIRCREFLRDAAQRCHFRPKEEGALAWPGFFAAGGTFAIYDAHLDEACLLLGVGARRGTKAPTTGSRGLAEAGNENLSLRPAVPRQQLPQIVATGG